MPPVSGKPLTDVAARNAKPREKPYKLAAGGGLYLEVMPAGARYWRLKYRFAGREKRLAIGVYPEVSLKVAATERDNARALLRSGRDPSADKQAGKLRAKLSADNSFESIAREWLDVKAHGWTERQLLKERARLEKHAFPWLGKQPIDDISVVQLRPVLLRITKAGHLDQAHRLQQQLSRIFRFAIASERAQRDPAADLRDILPSHTKTNLAHITSPFEVGELLRAIDSFNGTFTVLCALQLASLTFARPGEIRGAEWEEIDFDAEQWAIAPNRRKLKKALKENPNTPPHVVPLSRQAMELLRELSALTGNGKYVFPSARGASRSISENTLNAGLRRMGYDSNTMTAHGFRHTASTLLNEQGIWSKDAIERQLSHKEPGVGGVYNKAELLPERRKMMQAWADYLDTLRASDGNVVSIVKRKVA